jgi:hypothetical protein
MLRRAFVVVVGCALLSVAVSATGLDGTWKGSVETPNGPMELTFVFKADGEALTGTVGSAMGELPLENGKVEGDTATFDVSVEGSTIKHEARRDGDTIAIKATGDWGTIDYVVSRVR